jgi:NitT/TauT family transport system substrate-binding protein
MKELLLSILIAVTLAPGALLAQGTVMVRAGLFPNITHSQALMRRVNGAFEKALAPQAKVSWKIFNAGPTVIEAIFAGQLDLAYVGPNPAISGYVRSQGQALKIVAGATSGGAALVVRGGLRIQKPEDFRGRKIASPQLGNTQDVALRAWLAKYGMQTTEKGGNVQVIPIANADQITLFAKKEIDAAWAPEPWASRLVHEAGGRLFLDERTLWAQGQFVTTHLIVNTKFLREHRDIVKRWVGAHVDLTDWINANLPEAKRTINQEIAKETGKALAAKVLEDSFSRLNITFDPIRASLISSAKAAFDSGFLGRRQPNLSGIYDLTVLNEVLKEKGRAAIR